MVRHDEMVVSGGLAESINHHRERGGSGTLGMASEEVRREMPTSKVEQETIIRWDQEERLALLYTAYLPDAQRWEKLQYPVKVSGRGQDGTPRSWKAEVPIGAIRWRPMRDGEVVRKRGHRKGRLLGIRRDEMIESDDTCSEAIQE